MTDKKLMADRFSKAAGTYTDNALIQRRVAFRLVESLRCLCSTDSAGNGDEVLGHIGGKVLEIGCGTGIFSRMFLSEFCPDALILNDISEGYAGSFQDITYAGHLAFLPGDAESVGFPADLDMVVSCSALQWFHDLPAFFSKVHAHLSDGGLLAFTTFGKRNLEELSALEGKSLEYFSLEELGAMLDRGFEILWSEEYVQTLYFDDAVSVLRHLKNTGVTGVRKEFWTRGRLESFSRRYSEDFADGSGHLPLTYHPEILVCRKRP